MFSISAYLNEWFDTTKSVLTHPRDFFKEMPTAGSLKEPLNFMVFTTVLASLLCIPIIMLVFADYLPGIDLSRIILLVSGLFLISLFFMAISVPLNAVTYHFLLRICGANGEFKTTLRVFCYYMSSFLVILPAIGILMLIFYTSEKIGLEGELFDIMAFILLVIGVLILAYYALYVLLVGFSEAHRMSMKRVILAVVGIPMAINILLATIPVAVLFITGFY
jgi:hypothetical protein